MATNNNTILEMRDIVKYFPGVRAVDHVDFSVREGEVHCLLGENGAGKSTLIKILTGVYQPDEGQIFFYGKELRNITPRSAQQAGISAIYQELQLVPSLTIAENVFLGREPLSKLGRININDIREETVKLFADLHMHIDPDWLISDISVGLRQMTEVVKVVARGGKLVIMDEPTTSLNENEIANLFATVKNIQKRGVSVVYISHRMEEIFEIGDRASVLRDGKLVGTEVINRSSTSKLISMMVGRNLDEKFYKEKVPINDVIWRGEHLSSETGLIQDVNLEVRSGEILGLAGIRGSGYKELARMIGGADKISDGYLIDKENRKYRFNDPIDAISAGIGYLPDDRKGEGLILMLSIRQNITLPILNRISSGGWVNYDKTVKIANRYAKDLNIQAPSTDRSVEFLSGGNQQKVVMAKWLASGCRLLVLDGPTQGIDVGAKIEMYRLIASHVSAGGAVILVSSELPELMAIADRVMVIRDGRKVGEVIPDKSNQEEVLHMATAGEALN